MKFLELKIPPLLVVILIAGAMLLIAPLYPQFNFGPLPLWLPIAISALGILLPTIAAINFRRAATTVHPTHPDKTSQLVTSGVYRITRNPMYLGFALLLLAWGLYLANMVALFGLPAYMFYMNQFQIKPEERILKQKFGQQYHAFIKRTRRWL